MPTQGLAGVMAYEWLQCAPSEAGTSASGGLIYIEWGMMDGVLSGVMESRIY